MNFFEEKKHGHSQNILIYTAKQFMMAIKIPRKVYIFKEDGASGVQVGDIQVID